MESLTNADIFFIVTTVVVILVGAAWAVAIYYVIKILREIKIFLFSIEKWITKWRRKKD